MAPIDKVCPKNKGVYIVTMKYLMSEEALEIELLSRNSWLISEVSSAAKGRLNVLFADIAL